MDNPEKLTTQDEEKQKTKTQFYTQANTNNVNKTWALLQTTRGNDEPNILCLKYVKLLYQNNLAKLVILWSNNSWKGNFFGK